jgi:SAM-dependent methyltransferase
MLHNENNHGLALMFLAKLISTRIFSLQAKRPSGWFGRVVMSRIFMKGNAGLNSFIKDLLDLQENDRVLEIGFGPGMLLHQMAQITTKGVVEGIDFSEAMLAQANKTNKHDISTKRVKIQKGSCHDLPYSQGTFDKVCTSNTIYFFDDPLENFQEIFRIVKPRGKLVVGFRDKAQMKNMPLSDDVFNVYTQDEVKGFLLNAGFSDVRIAVKEGKPLDLYCAVATKA